MAFAKGVSAVGDKLVTQWPFFLTTVVALVGVWFLQTFLKSDTLSKIPLVLSEVREDKKRQETFLLDAQPFYDKAYQILKKGRGVCRLPSSRASPVVVLDPKFLPELRNLPDDVLDFAGAIDEVMHPEFTNANARRKIVPHVVQRDLTPGLSRLNPIISEEVDLAFQEELPPCKDWTRVRLNQHLLRIIAKVSGRIFVGPELCRTEEYIDMAINYTVKTMQTVNAISNIVPSERKDKASALPEVKDLKARQKTAYDFIKPVIEARKKAMKENPDFQKPDDTLQWILDGGQAKYGEQDDEELTQIQLGLTFAAIHTTTMTTTNAMYCLAVMPDLVPELREEIRTVLKEYGDFTAAALQKMKKLDSFLREVMRVHPLGWGSFMRKVHKPIVLSNGQVIPAGCNIEVAAYNSMHDPDNIANPMEFDALRWYRQRQGEELKGAEKASAESANQMVTVSPTALTFGYGRHACPGRFFAANEIKMIMGHAILDYDFKNADGSMERYPNLKMYETNTPDPTRELLFKRVPV